MSLNRIKINDVTTINTGVVYDISKATGQSYETLSDALWTDGNNVPPEVREGGMSVRFVHTGDNKYVQYRLITTSFSANINNWLSCNVETPFVDFTNEANDYIKEIYLKINDSSLSIPSLDMHVFGICNTYNSSIGCAANCTKFYIYLTSGGGNVGSVESTPITNLYDENGVNTYAILSASKKDDSRDINHTIYVILDIAKFKAKYGDSQNFIASGDTTLNMPYILEKANSPLIQQYILRQEIEAAEAANMDNVPTLNSNKPVKSNGIAVPMLGEKQLSIYPSYRDLYIEEPAGANNDNNVYIKCSDFKVRVFATADLNTMSQLAAALGVELVTSQKGVTECVKIPNENIWVFNASTKTHSIKDRHDVNVNDIIILSCMNGRVIRTGLGLGEQNHSNQLNSINLVQTQSIIPANTEISLLKSNMHIGSLQGNETGAPSTLYIHCLYSDFLRLPVNSVNNTLTFTLNNQKEINGELYKTCIRVEQRGKNNFDDGDYNFAFVGYDVPSNNKVSISGNKYWMSIGVLYKKISDNSDYTGNALDVYEDGDVKYSCDRVISNFHIDYIRPLQNDVNTLKSKELNLENRVSNLESLVTPMQDSSIEANDYIKEIYIRINDDTLPVPKMAIGIFALCNIYSGAIDGGPNKAKIHFYASDDNYTANCGIFGYRDDVKFENLYVNGVNTCAVLSKTFSNDSRGLNHTIFLIIDIAKFKARYGDSQNYIFNTSNKVTGILNMSSCCDKTNSPLIQQYLLGQSFDPNDIKDDIYHHIAENIEYNAITQISRNPRQGLTVKGNALVFGWMSDLHYDLALLKKYIELCSLNTDIDDILISGDIISAYWSQVGSGDSYSITKYLAVEGAENILLGVGNHDAWETDYHVLSNKDDVYDRLFAPSIDNWGVTHSNKNLYWYKDYDNEGIRLISLDCMYWDTDQKNWLKDTLDDARENDLSVICISHYTPGALDLFECSFTSIQDRDSFANTHLNAEASAIVDNFIKGDNSDPNNFISPGKFICWICGHTHKDYVGKMHDYPEQVVIVMTTSSSDNDQTAYCDSKRYGNEYALYAMNLFRVDTWTKKISILRIGDNIDTYMRKRTSMCIDYENRTLIYCS